MKECIIKCGVQMVRVQKFPGPATHANMHSLISNAEHDACQLCITYTRKQ